MSARSLLSVAVASVVALVLCAAGIGGLFVGTGGDVTCTSPAATGPTPTSSSGAEGHWPPIGRWSPEQVSLAATIVTVGTRMGVPHRGWVIALATAMQESDLRNLPGGDRDSVGLFQQRPSQGWGTPAQLQDPVYAADKFYDKLLTIDGWLTMPLTEAAQHVQASAYPHAYAKWEDDATALVNQITSRTPMCVPVGPGGWVMPVTGPIISGFRTPERPGHDGIDIAAAKGTAIRAAAAGTIINIECNASLGAVPYSCDIDGSSQVRGCGWYLEVLHSPNLITRYCHLLTRPPLAIGQPVAAAQPIGLVGSSGNSLGPHLHWEVHLGYPATETNAIDPVAFLRSVGVTGK